MRSALPVVIREATATDIPALARLHVITWNDTYPGVRSPPTVETREKQWREQFARPEGERFCFLVVGDDGELVGFAEGRRYGEGDPSDYGGQLSKIYLLREYHRLGIGRRLVGLVARRFLEQGISSMLVFAEATNPSRGFYETLGGEPLREPDGSLSGGNFGWRDLRILAARCPVD
jgi:ribosomal protein S18 acetylase RimI-like enzyme